MSDENENVSLAEDKIRTDASPTVKKVELDTLIDGRSDSPRHKKTKKKFKIGIKDDSVEDDKAPSISYFTLFRFASKCDVCYITTALLSNVIAGCVTPFNTIVFSDMLHAMVVYGAGETTGDDFWREVVRFALLNLLFAAVLVVFVFLGTCLMNRSSYNQIFRIRQAYLTAALNQDFAWYDLHESGDFASKMTEDLVKLEEGINEKLGSFVYYMAAFLSSITMALVKGWKLALVCLVSFPVTLILVGSVGIIASRLSKKESVAYGKAANVAEEVLGAIRTVYAFEGQGKEQARFERHLREAKIINIKRGFFSGCSMGVLFFCIYATYALSFWYGVQLLSDPNENYDAGTMMAVFFGVMMGSMNFGISTPLMEVFGVARGAGAQVFRLIDTVPTINPQVERGLRPAKVQGNIALEGVHFKYPSRPDVPVLQGASVSVQRGQSVALVGSSGCGKSTIVQLLSRFYDPDLGAVKLDGTDIRELSVSWLRAQIGLVGQEPVLFNTTVGENIRYGREDATVPDIVAAAKAANAHAFISKLPNGYDTLVGDRGTQLSGGQKQRIAIARALVRNPSILLLDEATSALDNTSEAIVQAALDKAREGRTTVIVAHRLSTIRNADLIYVLREGRVVEQGKHTELMAQRGVYYDMVALQTSPIELVDADSSPLTPDRSGSNVASATQLSETVPEEFPDVVEEAEEKESKAKFSEVLAYSKPEWLLNTIACAGALGMGFGMPLFAILFGDFVGNLSSPESMAAETDRLSVMFLILGIVIGTFTFIQTFVFAITGEKLTERLRQMMFAALLRQEIGFYDDKKNSIGAMCARLSGDASLVQGATGQRIGTVLQGVGSLGLGTAIALYYEWRLGLVIFAASPLIVVLVYQQVKMAHQQSAGAAETMAESTKLAVDAVSNVRTVASLGRQKVFVETFREKLEPGLRLAKRGTYIRGAVYAASRAIVNLVYAAAMLYGGHLILYNGVPYEDVLKTSQALIMSTANVGSMFAFAPNFEKGLSAAARIIRILKRTPQIQDPDKPVLEVFRAKGNAQLSDVHFSYPTRPTLAVLRGLRLAVRESATVALVGASGCGKSTVIQLLLRFYDPARGTVSLDEVPVNQLRLSEMRKNIGLVQQEPVLFDRTIGENVAYGDNTREPSMDEIVGAAKKANIHNFITSLPQGYETRLGSKGTQLSGGQKQRIAIARALLRNPRILLLDEATSALDAASEKVVQSALDEAKKGRTCITIAHRLTTIKDADVICVIHKGALGEMGTHQQLIDKKGLYYKLYSTSFKAV